MKSAPYVPPSLMELPEIPLYMDQLMEWMEKKMIFLQEGVEKPILTKTMVNNYVKSGIVEKPLKKKYARDQIMELLMVCHWKNVLTMEEMAMLVKEGRKGSSVEDLYSLYRSLCLAFEQGQGVPASQKDQSWARTVYNVIVSEWNRRKAKEMLRAFSKEETP
ncbi:DUF1836 domain-containing protein [Alkalibacter rhizosphaerae]|uniref:DUF1836 domain-containing protein n=1 Tax=Alkalibacter rhizosphaerae TaxID=2815577 RepID=A0A974XGB7_9FIRM|nr:DUF1836 domain-containing protein [Alkalibacter rhizosphaerae]QSX07788.1 DUF1836 domain-containing protein [Alkalibacter rhizosphaerae]